MLQPNGVIAGATAAEFSAARFGGPTRIRTTNPTVDTTPTRVFSNNPKRVFWLVVNLSPNVGYLGFDRLVSATNGLPLSSVGGTISMDVQEDGEGVAWEVTGILPTAAGLWYGFEIERI